MQDEISVHKSHDTQEASNVWPQPAWHRDDIVYMHRKWQACGPKRLRHKNTQTNQGAITLPANSLRSLSGHQRNVIRMAFRWRADTGPFFEAYREILMTLIDTENTLNTV